MPSLTNTQSLIIDHQETVLKFPEGDLVSRAARTWYLAHVDRLVKNEYEKWNN